MDLTQPGLLPEVRDPGKLDRGQIQLPAPLGAFRTMAGAVPSPVPRAPLAEEATDVPWVAGKPLDTPSHLP